MARRLSSQDLQALAQGVREGQRRSLARAITLVESERTDHTRQAQELLGSLLDATGKAVRVGITGTPGVGKSTFIEALGLWLVEQGKRVAVLAVDPSSPISGGSILGDKTRMERLGREPQAFIRPSPSQGALGGVARRTREAMLLCEAAGFDVVLVETVGVGQSEIEVSAMVDTFLLLMQPGSGDSLQGVKRGVLELCDLLVVNKADGELLPAAHRARQQYEQGLSMLRPATVGWSPPVLLCSALEGSGIDAVWERVQAHRHLLNESGLLEARRAEQAEHWMWRVIKDELEARFRGATSVQPRIQDTIQKVRSGETAPTQAALHLLRAFFDDEEP